MHSETTKSALAVNLSKNTLVGTLIIGVPSKARTRNGALVTYRHHQLWHFYLSSVNLFECWMRIERILIYLRETCDHSSYVNVFQRVSTKTTSELGIEFIDKCFHVKGESGTLFNQSI